jgi:hypothetical protein
MKIEVHGQKKPTPSSCVTESRIGSESSPELPEERNAIKYCPTVSSRQNIALLIILNKGDAKKMKMASAAGASHAYFDANIRWWLRWLVGWLVGVWVSRPCGSCRVNALFWVPLARLSPD